MTRDRIVGILIGGGAVLLVSIIIFVLKMRSHRKAQTKLKAQLETQLANLEVALIKTTKERDTARKDVEQIWDNVSKREELLELYRRLQLAHNRIERELSESLLRNQLAELNGIAFSVYEVWMQATTYYLSKPSSAAHALFLKQFGLTIINALKERNFDERKIRTLLQSAQTQAARLGFNPDIFPRIKTLCDGTLLQILAKLEPHVSPAASGQRPALKARPVQKRPSMFPPSGEQPDSKERPVRFIETAAGDSLEVLNESEDEGATVVFVPSSRSPSSRPEPVVSNPGDVDGSSFDAFKRMLNSDEPVDSEAAVRPISPPASAGGALGKAVVGIADTLPSERDFVPPQSRRSLSPTGTRRS
jgi:hypothetical protein